MSTLFVADADTVFQFILGKLLTKYPVFIKVQYFKCGVPLLAHLSDHKDNAAQLPDVIFLELYFKSVSGWDILNNLQALYSSLCKKIEVYVVTASVADIDRDRVCAYSCVREFVSKPLSLEKVIAIANRHQYVERI